MPMNKKVNDPNAYKERLHEAKNVMLWAEPFVTKDSLEQKILQK